MINKSSNKNLHKAKIVKNDEFYTQFKEIESEMNSYLEYDPNVFRGKCILLPCDDPEWSNFTRYFAQNFELLGLKKLISTSYAPDSKNNQEYIPTLFEMNDSQFDAEKTHTNGKIFVLTEDKTSDGKIDINDLSWNYLQGDGDFRSTEIKKLRDEADIIITNPPFSLFREFLAWIVDDYKRFIIVGNMNAITYKEVFPLLKNNKMWVGATSLVKDMVFEVPSGTYVSEKDQQKVKKMGYEGDFTRLGNSCWFTNLDHGRRHQPLQLMTMADNLKFNKKLKGKNAYVKYSNFGAIEVPFTEAIPIDYDGVMGVPISFLDKYNPDQFEIIGSNLTHGIPISEIAQKGTYAQGGPSFYIANDDGLFTRVYTRILIKHKRVQHENN